MRFLNSVTVPENVKGGPFGIFLTSILLQIIETIERGPFGVRTIFGKKSHSSEKI